MKYYIRSNGKTYGPIEENKIRDRALSGFFNAASLVSADLKEWIPLQQCISIPQPATAPDIAAEERVDEVVTDEPPALHFIKPVPVIQETDIPEPKQAPFNRKKLMVILLCAVVIILLGCAIFFMFRYITMSRLSGSFAPGNFQQVCKTYQSAVGIVVVTLEDSDGKLLNCNFGGFKVSSDYPIGTAFAIDRNKFATNCHVAYGVKDLKVTELEKFLKYIVCVAAVKQGVKTEGDLIQFCKKYEKEIADLRKQLHANVRVRDVEIRLAHTGGRSLIVTGVQIHPRYQASPDKDSVFKNGEFDIAILTTADMVDRFFKTAPAKKLYSLAAGQEIAYLGFPMEGLLDNGNLDLDRPEAIFKSGTINKITDFNKVFSSPEFNKSIIHDIPAAGGASGSPIFLPDGEVIAILWGVTHSGKNQLGRIASAIQHNMAVRIDSINTVKKQKIHSMKEWLGEDKK